MKLIWFVSFLLFSNLSYAQIFGPDPSEVISELISILNDLEATKRIDTTVTVFETNYRIEVKEVKNSVVFNVESGDNIIYSLYKSNRVFRVKKPYANYTCKFDFNEMRINSIEYNSEFFSCKVFFDKNGEIKRARTSDKSKKEVVLKRFSYQNTYTLVSSSAPLEFLRALGNN
jgi:hypothetical protein